MWQSCQSVCEAKYFLFFFVMQQKLNTFLCNKAYFLFEVSLDLIFQFFNNTLYIFQEKKTNPSLQKVRI
jgi:hypothetical protein